jgi:glycosyltransferase involved in cell wall biosynthesis
VSPVSVVTPVYGNAATLGELAAQVAAALADRPWRLRLVVDASPDDSLAVAHGLAASDERVAVTALAANVGQHKALARGLADEGGPGPWVCLDADLQDPPEAIPLLLDRLTADPAVDAVFAGRRGRYERWDRLVGARAHRRLLSWITGLPPDAGAFVALGPAARHAILRRDAPSIVAAIGVAGLRVASLPVPRVPRPSGGSAWSGTARLRQSARTLTWAMRQRGLTQRCTSVSA